MQVEQVVGNVSRRQIPIITGIQKVPLKGIIYGDNGAGKTSTLSHAMNPFIFDMEGNCSQIEAARTTITNLTQYNNAVDYLLYESHEYKSLIIDSLDSIETFLTQQMEGQYGKSQLEYSRDGKILKAGAQDILVKLDKLHRERKMNILFTAHLDTKAANNPMVENFDRFDLRLHKSMKTVFCNWVQFICLLQKVPTLEKGGGFGKMKAKDNDRRVLHTRGTPTYYGKNVFNLPSEIYMGNNAEEGWKKFIEQINNFYSN
jgi:hypothetical protein